MMETPRVSDIEHVADLFGTGMMDTGTEIRNKTETFIGTPLQ